MGSSKESMYLPIRVTRSLSVRSTRSSKNASKGPKQQISCKPLQNLQKDRSLLNQTTRSSNKASKGPKQQTSCKQDLQKGRPISVRTTRSSKKASKGTKQRTSCKSSQRLKKARTKAPKPAARGTTPPNDLASSPRKKLALLALNEIAVIQLLDAPCVSLVANSNDAYI